MMQVYCDNTDRTNKWLKEHPNVEVIDIKMSLSVEGKLIMVIYAEGETT